VDKDDFRTALDTLGLTCQDFAALGGWSCATVYEWGARLPVPRPARTILALYAQVQGVSIPGKVEALGGGREAVGMGAERFRI
jgi:hypothetical protein